MLIPRTKVPDLKFPLTNNSEFDLPTVQLMSGHKNPGVFMININLLILLQ